MKEIAEAFLNMTAQQLLAVIVLLTPISAAIWAVVKWAYETRLKSLEVSLSELRVDFERRVSREIEKFSSQCRADQEEVERRHIEQIAELEMANGTLSEILSGSTETWKFGPIDSSGDLIIENKAELDNLKKYAHAGLPLAQYNLAKQLVGGRILLDNTYIAQDRTAAQMLIEKAANSGHEQAKIAGRNIATTPRQFPPPHTRRPNGLGTRAGEGRNGGTRAFPITGSYFVLVP